MKDYIPAGSPWVNNADMWYCDGWLDMPDDWKKLTAVHEWGHILGLADEYDQPDTTLNHLVCLPVPRWGVMSVMGLMVPTTGTYQTSPACSTNPFTADLIGVLCVVYDYDDACPDFGFSWAGLGGSSFSNAPDQDADGIEDDQDNCLIVANMTQDDTDIDGFGDSCDSDDDSDGFMDVVETHVGTDPIIPCAASNAWPIDFVWGGTPSSTNKVTLVDLTSFLAPIRRLGTSFNDPGYSARWDLVPGSGMFSKDININDLTAVITSAPPVLGGTRAFNGPFCNSQLLQLMTAVRGNKQYRDPAVAEANGFERASYFTPGRGSLVGDDLRLDDPPDITQPQGFLYDQHGRLAGLVYAVPRGDPPGAPPNLFLGDPAWYSHDTFCWYSETFEWHPDDPCTSGTQIERKVWIQIAWVFGKPNPNGVFADTNPRLN
jgi:hypothetical protein